MERTFKMPGKQARALCPVCREAMPPDETECRNCGAFVIDEAVVRLSRAFGIDREKALQLFEAGFRHPTDLRGRRIDEVLEKRESGLLFICTNCGSFVASGDATCPRCAAEFEAGEEEAPQLEEEDILDLVLCPNCGADNGPEEAECEICGEPLKPTRPASPPVEATRPAEPRQPSPEPGHDELEKVDLMLDDLEPTKLPEEEPKAAPPRPAPPPVAAPEKLERPVARGPPKPPVSRPAAPPPRGPFGPSVQTRTPARSTARVSPMPHATTRVPPATARESPTRPIAAKESATRTVKRPVEIRVARARRARGTTRKSRTWTGPPPEFMGPAVLASAVGLYASREMDQTNASWAIAFALAAFSGYAIAASVPSRTARLGLLDKILLAAGAGFVWMAIGIQSWFGVSAEAVSLFTIAGAIPLAWATRRILRAPARALLAAAGGIPLIALAVAAGQDLGFAGSSAWILGLLASVPWPLALAAMDIRNRVVERAARRHLLEAERDYARQDYAKSLEDYDRAIALAEKGATQQDLPWYGKGATLVLLGQYEEALRAIDRALDINPRNEVAWVNKGNALTKMGRLVDALRCFNAALKVNPRYEVAWNNKGNALARLGRYEEALRCYERALEVDITYRGAWVNKGYVLAKLGRYDEAAQCADRVVQLAASERLRAA